MIILDKNILDTSLVIALIFIVLVGIVTANSSGPLLILSNTINKVQAQEQLQQPKTAATREVAAG